jgi:hypothetical protein
MKTLLSLVLSLTITSFLFSQDLIVLKNGTQINGSILEVTPSLVKFKKTSDGPVYSMNLTDLSSITYKNGTVENFGPAPVVTKSNTPVTPDPKEDEMLIPTKRYGGPRVGLTYISSGTTRTRIAEAFDRADITPFVSQFGWQFETRIFTLESGGAGLVEFIPMIGGLEQGLFLPSASGILGFRAANGIEFGVGPSASLAGFGLVMAAGASFKVGKITFPFNIAFSPNIKKILPDEQVYNPSTGTYDIVPGETTNSGFRLSLLVGFNSRKG